MAGSIPDERMTGTTKRLKPMKDGRNHRRLVVNPPVTPFDSENPYTIPPAAGYIRMKLRDVALARGCIVPNGTHKGEANLSAITRGTGLAWTTVQELAGNPNDIRGIKLETIARLCAFFQCTPGDLMEYVQYTGKRPRVERQILDIVEEDDSNIEPVVSTGISRW
jgi:DNA-binding Xre family transcriptional regulator